MYFFFCFFIGLTGSALQAATLVAQWSDFSKTDENGNILPTLGRSVADGNPWFLIPGSDNSLADGVLTFGGTDSATIQIPEGSAYGIGGYDQAAGGFAIVLTVSGVTSENQREVLWTLNRPGQNDQIGMGLHSGGTGSQGIWGQNYWSGGNETSIASFPHTSEMQTFFTLCDSPNYTKIYRDGELVRHCVGLRGGFAQATSFSIGGMTAGAPNRALAKYTVHGIAIYAGVPESGVWTSPLQQYTTLWRGTTEGGSNYGTWLAGTDASNFQNPAVGATHFSNGDSTLFPDINNAGESIVTITGAVSPASWVVYSSSTDYTFLGTGSVSGSGSLLKQGDATLTLQSGNTFSGGLIVEGGTVIEYALNAFQGALGSGKNGAWANQVTLKNGTFDLNNAKNYRNTAQDAEGYWGWLSVQTMTLGGMPGNARIENGIFGIGADTAFVYDAANDPGTATVAADWKFTGTSSAATRTVTVGDSSATDVELDFTGGMSGVEWLEGCGTTILKNGAGTMRISCENYFPRLTIAAGKIIINSPQALGKRHTSTGTNLSNILTVNAELDLNGYDQAVEYLAGSGTITSETPATLTVGQETFTDTTAYSGALHGAVSLRKTGATTLSLSGEIKTSGTLETTGGTLRIETAAATDPAADAPIQLGSAPEFRGMMLSLTNALILETGSYPIMAWEGAVPPETSMPDAEGLNENQSLVFNETRTALLVQVFETRPFVTVMPLGDSITEGSSDGSNYRGPLSVKMADYGYRPDFVGPRTIKPGETLAGCAEHCGWSGARIVGKDSRTGILDNIDTYLDVTGYPDVILLKIGTNDISSRTAKECFELWTKLVQRILLLRPQSQLIVTTILPFQTENTTVDAFNASIRSCFTDGFPNAAGNARFGEGARLSFVDMNLALPRDAGLNYYLDSLHPNWTGHRVMADAWLAGIQRVLPVTGPDDRARVVHAANNLDLSTRQITVTFNKSIPEIEWSPSNYTITGEGVTVNEVTLLPEARQAVYTLSAPLPPKTLCTVIDTQTNDTFSFTVRTPGAENNIAPELLEDYVRIKTLTIDPDATINASTPANYENELDPANIPQNFNRIGYYLELVHQNNPNDLRYIWVSMDAFTVSIDQVGVPANVSIQRKVSNLQIDTNAPHVRNVTEPGVEGIIEFTPASIGTGSAGKGFPADPGNFYGWDDTITSGAYGAMQVFRIYEENEEAVSTHPAETLFAYNRWNTAGSAELGIGTFGSHLNAAGATQTASVDWIFTSGLPEFDASCYTVRNMAFYVMPGKEVYWNAGDGNWHTESAWSSAEEGGTPVSFAGGDSVHLTSQGAGMITLDRVTSAGYMTLAGDYTLVGSGSLAVQQNLTFSGAAELTANIPLTVFGNTVLTENSVSVNEPAVFEGGVIGSGRVTTASDTTVNLSGAGAVRQNMPAYTVNAGTLTIHKPQSGDSVMTAPSFTVSAGAGLVLDGNDIIGWTRANTLNVATIAGTLEKRTDANETFSGQLTLSGNARVINSAATADRFMFHNNSRILVTGDDADVAFSGTRYKANNGTTTFDVTEAGAVLTFAAPLNVAAPISKTGSGEWIQTEGTTGSGTVTIESGLLTMNAVWNNGGNIAIGANGRIRGTGTFSTFAANGWLRGGGTFEGGVNGNGTLEAAEFRPWPGAKLAVTFTEDGMACGLLKTEKIHFGSADSTLTVSSITGNGKLLRYKILEADIVAQDDDSPGVVLADNITTWVLEKATEGDKTVWYLVQKAGLLIVIY